jgi:uncharacterized protein YegJ (DUF2314 family)
MAAALAGPDTLAMYSPDTDVLLAYDQSLAGSLRSDDPVARFAASETAGAASSEGVEMKQDDPRLKKAESEAKHRWSDYVDAFRARRRDKFSVKGRIIEGEQSEYMWLTVTELDEHAVHGMLANEPEKLSGLKMGQDLHIPIDDVDDWLYIGTDKQVRGDFTRKALEEAAKTASER